jgi:SpoVK/Ycf46/Vps4 family AAA+-type ATPase
MTSNELIKLLIISFNSKDSDAFLGAVREYIERERRMKHTQVAKELEKVLFEKSSSANSFAERRFKNSPPIPRDSEKGFPLLEIRQCDESWENLILAQNAKSQLEQIIKEFKDADILATYNLKYKQKILLCGKPGTGKTFTARIVSSLLQIPLVYVRFDAIISSYLGETAANLRKVFDFIEHGIWIVLFDEFDIIGKNRDDSHEHGEIKRVVNNFLQMLDNYNGASIVFAATNHQYMLDPAIWRRFDDVVYYQLPDSETRSLLLERFLRSMSRADEINTQRIVEMTEALSPADIKMIAEEAMKLSIIDSRNKLEMTDLENAAKKFIAREKVKNTSMEQQNEPV